MSEPKQSTPPSGQSEKGLSSRVIRIGQIAGACTAVITAGGLIWTQFKPGPPPAILRASLTHVGTFAPRSEFNYFNSHPGQLAAQEAHLHAQGVGREEIGEILHKPGATIEFTIELEAPVGREYRVTETLYRSPTEEAITPVYGHFAKERIVARAGKYETTESSWIEYPPRAGTYFVEVDMIDKEGNNAAPPARSATFHVPRS